MYHETSRWKNTTTLAGNFHIAKGRRMTRNLETFPHSSTANELMSRLRATASAFLLVGNVTRRTGPLAQTWNGLTFYPKVIWHAYSKLSVCHDAVVTTNPGVSDIAPTKLLPALKCRLQARIEGARPRWTERTRVRELRAAIGEIGHSTGVEKRSIGRIAVIEDIVRTGVDLERLVDLIRGVQVENCIGRQPLCLVGFVADKVLAVDEQRIPTNLECVGDGIIDAGLDPIAWDCRDSIAGQNLDVAAGGVGKRAVGADLQRVQETRVHESIAGV